MLMLTLNVIYVLIAIAIIVMVLMQRGSGAAAGSGFGAGASGTVFGARGASNFLSKSTKWLAITFFAISLFMAWNASHRARPVVEQNLGVMAEQPVPGAVGELPTQAQPSTVPSAPAGTPTANDYHMISPERPFGGYKQSGIGRELGTAGFEIYRQAKHVHTNPSTGRDGYMHFAALSGNI